MGFRRTVVVAAGALAAVGVSAPQSMAVPVAQSEVARAKDTLAPLLKSRVLVAGDTWRQTVRVKGYKQIKLQVKAGSGPFRTVKSFKVPKSGKVRLSWTFAKPGGYFLRSIAIREGAGRDVKSKPVIITAVARQYSGTFGGMHTSGTSWDGTITYQYQERDPVTNQPWDDGKVHYTGIEGSVTWKFDASVLNNPNAGVYVARRNCAAAPGSGQLDVASLSSFVEVDQERKVGKGQRYRVNVTVTDAVRTPYTCEYLEEDDNFNEIWVPRTKELSLQFGPNIGDLLTNALSEAATGIGGQYTSSPSAPLVGDINRPPESITNRWYWNLTPR